MLATLTPHKDLRLRRLELHERFKADSQGDSVVVMRHCATSQVSGEELVLELRGHLAFQNGVEVLELEGAALQELVNVDVLGHACCRLERLQEGLLLRVDLVNVFPLMRHLLSLRLLRLLRCLLLCRLSRICLDLGGILLFLAELFRFHIQYIYLIDSQI